MRDPKVLQRWVSAVLEGRFTSEAKIRRDNPLPPVMNPHVKSSESGSFISGEINHDTNEPRWPFNRRPETTDS